MEGNVPAHPLGFDRSQRFGPIKMVGGEIGGERVIKRVRVRSKFQWLISNNVGIHD